MSNSKRKFIVTQVGDEPPQITYYDSPQEEMDWEKEFRKLPIYIQQYDPHSFARAKTILKSFISQQIEEAYQRGQEEERQFILNILDGIDTADEQMGLPHNTEAIRFALRGRSLPVSDTKK